LSVGPLTVSVTPPTVSVTPLTGPSSERMSASEMMPTVSSSAEEEVASLPNEGIYSGLLS
jgi:hypothetical protein